MKTKKIITTMVTSFLTMVLFLSVSNATAQTKHMHHKMKDCCMMKNGKMMCIKNGKTMPMDKDMTMKNGTTCMTNGECTMKDGTKMKMKNGDCMYMSGKMKTKKMATKKIVADAYTCPMHHEVVGVKGDKCSKCGMDLVKK